MDLQVVIKSEISGTQQPRNSAGFRSKWSGIIQLSENFCIDLEEPAISERDAEAIAIALAHKQGQFERCESYPDTLRAIFPLIHSEL